MSKKKPHPRLQGPLLKIARANKHILEFRRAHDAFTKKHHPIWVEEDPKTGERIVRISKKRKFPARWSVIVGDALFNLRAALDHLACQLVVVGSGPSHVTSDTGFPISAKQEKLTAGHPKLKGMSPEAIWRIGALKPYKGGNDSLWILHRLNIIDKHKLLLMMVAVHQGTATHDADMPLFGDYLPVGDPRPLQHGDELARLNPRERKRGKLQFHLAVTFWETQVADLMPVPLLLEHLSKYVEHLVLDFEDLLG